MASKSKRRRKVLGASCILAALIIAGSSFAWFTSKDEVANRLSANADYGVSIVESFAPPENWVPGQEVNKDVYAVNTGNVAAFVEETVSGVLTVTTEKATDTLSADCVKLTKAERYVIEAGSYLAYVPDASNYKKGDKVVAMTPDPSDLNGYTPGATDFTPDAAGLYVFRRSIDVDNASTPKGEETFEYAAYYYDGHDYFKTTDLTLTPESTYYAGDADKTDGNLSAATCKYVVEETNKYVPTLEYDAAKNRLVASYKTGTDITDAQLTTLAENYDDALIAYEDALAEYQAALRDDTKADGEVGTANTALQNAINTLLEKQAELKTAQANLKAAQDAKAATAAALTKAQADAAAADAAATAAADAATAAADAVTTAQTAVTTAQTAVTTAQTAVTTAQTAVDGYAGTTAKSAFESYATSHGVTDLNTVTYETLSGLNITNTEVGYEYYEKLVALKLAQKTLAEKQADLADAQAEKAVKDQLKADADAAKTAADAAKADADAAKTAAETADAAAAAAVTAAEGAVTAAESAVTAAESAVTAAQTAYDGKVTAAGGASTNVTAAKNNAAAKKQALAEAKAAYDKANSATSGVLKININLSDNVGTSGAAADKWMLLPTPSDDETAYFYYTGILEAGETSTQLIDSVELDDSVTQDMFKRFDFDLNVALKSAQVSYDADGNVTADATTELDANAKLPANATTDSTVNWTLK